MTITITKLAAAESQFRQAVRLHFTGTDPASAHTLAAVWVLTGFPPGLLTSIPPWGALLRDGLTLPGWVPPGAFLWRT